MNLTELSRQKLRQVASFYDINPFRTTDAQNLLGVSCYEAVQQWKKLGYIYSCEGDRHWHRIHPEKVSEILSWKSKTAPLPVKQIMQQVERSVGALDPRLLVPGSIVNITVTIPR